MSNERLSSLTLLHIHPDIPVSIEKVIWPGSKSYTFEGPNNHVIGLVWRWMMNYQLDDIACTGACEQLA